MSNLTAAVLAAIAERRKVAEAATPGPWNTPGPDTLGQWRIYDGEWTVASAHPYSHNRPFSSRPDSRGPGYIDPDANAAFIAANDPTFSLANLDAWEAVVRRHELTTEDYTEMWWADRSKPSGTYVVTGCDRCRHAGVDGDEYLTPGLCDDLATVARLFLSVEQLAEYGVEPVAS